MLSSYVLYLHLEQVHMSMAAQRQAISYCHSQKLANVLQGKVAMRLRRCRIFNEKFVRNSLLRLMLKEFRKLVSTRRKSLYAGPG